MPRTLALAPAIGALVGACAVLGVADADAAKRAALAIAPTGGSLQTGTVNLRVRLPAGARKVWVSVAGTDVTRRLRGSGRRRRAAVRASSLEAGRATAVVRARTRAGKPLFAYGRLVVGRPKQTLLARRARVTKGAGTAKLRLRLRLRPSTMRVRLNGRRVPLLRMPHAGPAAVRLTAADGLRFGANEVALLAFDADTGRWSRMSRAFTMGRRAPLAAAGRDRRVAAGARVGLSAARTVTTGDEVPLGYRWRVVKRPHGAAPRLTGATTMRPRLKTTAAGRYRIRLELARHRARGASAAAARPVATDTVTVDAAATMTPWGIPMTTLVPDAGGNLTRTTIEGIPINPDGQSDYVDIPAQAAQLIVLDQATLGVVSSTRLTSFDAQSVKAAVHAGQVGILTGTSGCCDGLGRIGPVDTGDGFTTIVAGPSGWDNPIAYNAGITVVGSIWSGPRSAGAVSGLWRPSQTLAGDDEFTFSYPDAVTFDTKVTDSSVTGGSGFNIQLGGLNYNIDTSSAPSGIVINTMGADLVTPLGYNVYGLSGGASDQGRLTNLATVLDAFAKQYPGGVMQVQTWGSPKAHTTAWGDVGDALTQYGGTTSVWIELDGTGDYALVARAGAGASSSLQATASAEASGALSAANGGPASAGTLRGVIGRGPDSLAIVDGSTTMATTTSVDQNGKTYLVNPLALSPLAQAAPQAWPSSGGAFDAARAWISQQLGLGNPSANGTGLCYSPGTWDVRAEYCNKNLAGSWGDTYLNQLNGLSCPTDNTAFTASSCAEVQKQLAKEFSMISRVQSMFDQLQKPYGGAKAAATLDFVNAASAVDTSMSVTVPPGSFGIQEFVTDFFQPLQDIGLEESDPGISLVLGLFASGLDMALAQTSDSSGNPALDEFDSTKAGIGADATNRLIEASTQLDYVENMILTDWTKLSTAAYNATTVWGSDGLTAAQQTTAVTASTKAWLYETMMPLAYAQIAVVPKVGGNTAAGLNSVICIYGNYPGEYDRWPFRPGAVPDLRGNPSGGQALPDSAAFAPLTTTAADGTPSSPFVWGLGDPVGKESFQVPSASLTDLLFLPVTQTLNGSSGVGLTKEQFYSWGWVSGNRFSMADYIQKAALDYPTICG